MLTLYTHFQIWETLWYVCLWSSLRPYDTIHLQHIFTSVATDFRWLFQVQLLRTQNSFLISGSEIPQNQMFSWHMQQEKYTNLKHQKIQSWLCLSWILNHIGIYRNERTGQIVASIVLKEQKPSSYCNLTQKICLINDQFKHSCLSNWNNK